jgi:hypothetical protein
VTWPLLLVVWLRWGLSYPFTAWTLEGVDLITARLLANADAVTLLLLLGLRAQARRILRRRQRRRQRRLLAVRPRPGRAAVARWYYHSRQS